MDMLRTPHSDKTIIYHLLVMNVCKTLSSGCVGGSFGRKSLVHLSVFLVLLHRYVVVKNTYHVKVAPPPLRKYFQYKCNSQVVSLWVHILFLCSLYCCTIITKKYTMNSVYLCCKSKPVNERVSQHFLLMVRYINSTYYCVLLSRS